MKERVEANNTSSEMIVAGCWCISITPLASPLHAMQQRPCYTSDWAFLMQRLVFE